MRRWGVRRSWGNAAWPVVDDTMINETAERDFTHLQDAVSAARNLRTEANLNPTQKINLYAQGDAAGVLYSNKEVMESLARATLLEEKPGGASLSQVVPDLELQLPFEGLVDVGEWRQRQEKRLAESEKNKQKSEKKLANSKFVKNAPAEVVAEERRRLEEETSLIRGIKESLAGARVSCRAGFQSAPIYLTSWVAVFSRMIVALNKELQPPYS